MGFDTGDIAPKFDPNSHFESPYYDYDNQGWGKGYWNRMNKGPWSNNNDGKDSAGGTLDKDSKEVAELDEKKEDEKKGDSKDADKKDGDKKEGEDDKKDSDKKEDSKDADKKEGEDKKKAFRQK